MHEARRACRGHPRSVQIRRVVVVDDHQVFTEVLAMTVSDQPDLRVVGGFGSTEPDLPAAVAGRRPDVVTVDVEPLEAAAADRLIERLTGAPDAPGVLVLSAVADPARVSAAARAGALGWLGKDASTTELLAALRRVGAGRAHYSAAQIGRVLRELVGELRRAGDRDGPLAVLSAQERRVLAGMVAGERGPEIAARLHLTTGTVRTHTQNIFGKLGVHSRLEAVTLARRAGLRPVVTERAR